MGDQVGVWGGGGGGGGGSGGVGVGVADQVHQGSPHQESALCGIDKRAL